MVAVPIGRPSVPVVVVRMMDYLDSGRLFLEIFNSNRIHIEGISTRGHDMHFHCAVFHMSTGRNIDGLRNSIRSKDKGVSIEYDVVFGFYDAGLISIDRLNPQSSRCFIIP
jgi:hypothetical protein